MQTKFKELLRQYKLDVFHRQHDKKNVEEITTECMHITDDVLKQKYHFHFHTLPNADRVEVINMINNYTREAILPPVIEKLVQRQVLLEKRVDALVHLTEQLLETLSGEGTPRNGH
ncbi:MAG: hypothetical protein IPJ19_02105 [Planctomycetes bacterium]|nr:hypothetical protein [Planctomycetota bacterium]